MSRVIAVYNNAGGVGKTTTTRDLGFALVRRGRRVLAIDADSQGSLGDFFGLQPYNRADSELFWDAVCFVSENEDDSDGKIPHVVETDFGIFIGLSNFSLVEMERRLTDHRDTARLLSVLSRMRDAYNIVLIDCPPSVSEITVQTLLAADELLIPVQTEGKAVAGLLNVQREIRKTNSRRRSIGRAPLKLAGIVPTIHNPNRAAHVHYLNEIRELAEDLGCVVLPPVRDRIAVLEACNARRPIQLHDPQCPVVDDIERIADHVLGMKNEE
jgi:chromosome partitioning protein